MDTSDYFNSLNSIAKKIVYDIEEIKSSYEHIWSTLSHHEQIEIINETIIKPEIALRYFDQFSSNDSIAEDELKINRFDGKNLRTYKDVSYGTKTMHDDLTRACNIHDEHSAPFSYKTKSQIDLSICSADDLVENETSTITPKMKLRLLKENLESTAAKKWNGVPEEQGYQKMDNIDVCDNTISKEVTNFFSKLIKKSSPPSAMEKEAIIQRKIDEQEQLVSDHNLNSSLSITSEDDEEKNNCEEFKSLLQDTTLKSKGYDFLADW